MFCFCCPLEKGFHDIVVNDEVKKKKFAIIIKWLLVGKRFVICFFFQAFFSSSPDFTLVLSLLQVGGRVINMTIINMKIDIQLLDRKRVRLG